MPEVLEGLRVLDLTWGTAGPVASMLLADYGADVVKVEPPGGDPFRALPAYTVWNRGKRSVCLDLAATPDRDTFDRLVADVDVVLESFAPGVATRLGVDYGRLSALNPRLVQCSITGYGTKGRLADRPGYDALVQARTGMQFEQPGIRGGRPGPVFFWSPLPSYGAALLATIGIGGALYEREQSGAGQHVETSLLQGVLAWATMPWHRVEHPTPTYYDTFRANCRDVSPNPSYVAGDGQWIHPMSEVFPAVLEELGLDADALARTDRSCDAIRRQQATFQELLERRPRQRWLDVFWAKDVRAQPVLSIEEAFEHPQLVANGVIHDIDVPSVGTVRQFAHPYQIAGRHNVLHGPPHEAGADTAAVVGGLTPRTGNASTSPASTAGRRARGPLAGIRVLDFGLALAGPYGPMVLSDLGADVIRVENARGRRPAGARAADARVEPAAERPRPPANPEVNANQTWTACQRGKRSISLDLKDPDGLAVAHALIATADVIHHNMRPGAADRLGIGFEDAKRLNPRIVYSHVTGFGSTGPLATFPGCDQLAQAITGLEHEQGATPDGGHPTWLRFGVGDHAAALTSVLGAVHGLWLRERTGEAQLVETSIASAATLLTSHAFLAPPGTISRWRLDRAQTGLGPLYRLYETREGWICIACVRDDHRSALLKTVGVDDATDDALLATRLEPAFRARTASEWFDMLDAAGVPCEVSSDAFIADWYDDPDLRAAGLISDYPQPHPLLGRVEQVGRLWHFSATPVAPELPPVVGAAHTREILAELGYEPAAIDDLLDREVAVQADLD